METSQWPLTAAATQILLAMPASSSKGAKAPPPKDAVKLGLKELLVRGAYRIQIEHKRLGKDKVTILPQRRPGLPSSLALFDGALRPHTPGEIGKVIKKARTRQSTLIKDIGEFFLWELVGHGLIEERAEKVLGIFSRKT